MLPTGGQYPRNPGVSGSAPALATGTSLVFVGANINVCCA